MVSQALPFRRKRLYLQYLYQMLFIMKKGILIVVISFLLPSCLQAQSLKALWRDVHSSASLHPQTAMAKLEKIIDAAEKKGAYLELLRADIALAGLKTDVAPDSLLPQLNRIRAHELLVRDREPVVASLYEAYLGLTVPDSVPYLRMALERKEALARAKAADYSSVVCLKQGSKYFGNDMLSVVGYAVGDVALLHDYYALHGNRAATMLTALDVLRGRSSAVGGSGQRSAYVASLDSLLHLYGDLEVSAEVAIEKYNVLVRNVDYTRAQRVAYIEEMLARYPKYERMNILRNAYRELINPYVNVDIKDILLTSRDTLTLKVAHRNIEKLRIKVDRIDRSTAELSTFDTDFEENWGDLKYKRRHRIGNVSQTITYSVTDRSKIERDTLRLSSLPVGMYIIETSTFPKTKKARCLLHVSDIRPIVVSLPDSTVRIAVVNAITSKPIGGAKIKIEDGETLYCNAQGEVTHRVKDDECAYAYTDYDRACTFVNLSEALIDDGDEEDTTYVKNVLTDRTVYRPGQTVHAAVTVFQRKDDRVTIDSGKDITFRLHDPQRKVIDSLTVKVDSYGTGTADFRLPARLLNGSYRVEVDGESCYIRVEEYKRPTFSVTVPDIETRYKAGDTLHLACKATALMGEGLSGAAVECKVSFNSYSYPSDFPDTTLVLTTDAKGVFMLDLPLPKIVKRGSKGYSLRLNATVTDRAGESQTADKYISVGCKAVQLSAPYADYVPRDSMKHLPFFARNNMKKELDATVRYWLKGYEEQVYTAKSGRPAGFVMPASLPNGRYTFVITCEDDTIERSYIVYNPEDRRPPAYVDSWVICPYNVFDKAGEEPLKIHFGTSQHDVHMVYTVATADSVLECSTVELSDSIVTREFYYRKEYGRGLVVSWAWYKNGVFYHEQAELIKPLPDSYLNLKWNTFRDRLQPGSKEQWQLTVTTADGKPAHARLIAAMYDKSLDYIDRNDWYFNTGISRELPQYEFATPNNYSWQTVGSSVIKRLPEPAFRSACLDLGNGLWGMKVSGKVVTDEGYPVIGCSVRTEGSASYGVVTDIGGNYTIVVPLGKRLVYSYIGYKKEVRMVTSRVMNVTLTDDDRSLNEVIVTGYGTAKKCALTGSVAGVTVRGAASVKYTAPVIKRDAALYGALAPKDDFFIPADNRKQASAALLPVRKNMAETAFFYPRLTTDEKGQVGISFTLPESITAWRFMGQAHTRDMKNGFIEAEAVAKKALMVQPNLPRFVRTTDKLTIQARLFNTTEVDLRGTGTLFLLDPETERLVYSRQVPFRAASDSSVTLTFPSIDMARIEPSKASLYICKVVVSAGNMSDGEQHYLPVLPDVEQVLRTIPFTQTAKGTERIDISRLFPRGSTGRKLTVEYVDNPAWMMLEALHAYAHPYDDCAVCQSIAYYSQCLAGHILASSPAIKATIETCRRDTSALCGLKSKLAQNEELKSIMLEETPWNVSADTETEQKRQLVDFFDTELLAEKMNTAISKLLHLQNTDGSWSWFKGMKGNRYITETVTEVLVRLNNMVGMRPQTKHMIDRAFAYLSRQEADMEYLYLCALDDRQPADKGKKGKRKLLNDAEKTAESMTILQRALTAIVMQKENTAHSRAVARRLVESIKQYSVYDKAKGRYFDTRRAGYSWLDYKIPTQVAAIEALRLITPEDTQTITEMQLWLLQEKRSQYWLTAINSAAAVYAFLSDSTSFVQPTVKDDAPVLRIDGKQLRMPQATAGLGYAKITVTPAGERLFTAEKKTKSVSWGALYAQYLQKTSDIQRSGSELSVTRQIIPVKPGPLKVGSKVRVRITLKAARDLDFVQVIDKRAACMEPVDQRSGYDGTYYCSNKDCATAYYISMLSKGTHTIEKEYYLDRSGTYTLGSVTAQCAYAPEYAATERAGAVITVE